LWLVPDDVYNPKSTKTDGAYPEEINWTYKDLPGEGINENLYNYNGPGPCLRQYIATRFRTLLEACGIVGGFMYKLINCITANSNAYNSKNMRGSNFAGCCGIRSLLKKCINFWVLC
jgi:hypothetical protein